MEDQTQIIEEMIRQKLELYRQLNTIMEKERDYIVDMDVDSLWKSSEEKKKISRKITLIRGEILSNVTAHTKAEEMTVQSFSMKTLLKTLPLGQGAQQRLRALKVSIDEEKDALLQTSQANQAHVKEYLSVIDDIMELAVGKKENTQYRSEGELRRDTPPRRLIQTEV